MIDEEIFSDWLENPVTAYFLRYLVDSAKEMSEIVANDIIDGVIVSESDQIKKSTMCVTLTGISEIDLEEINDFYQQEK